MTQKDFYTVFTEQTPSTMDLAKTFVQKQPHQGNILAFMTKNQTLGRGRGGTSWKQAETKANLTETNHQTLTHFNHFTEAILKENDFLPVTFVFPNERIKVPYEWITSLIGCALYDSLKITEDFIKSTLHHLPFNPQKSIYIKWPNDIIVFPNKITNNKEIQPYKKISGILCETTSSQGKIGDFFIGIGLNFFHHPSFDKSISFWESLFFSENNKSDKREINKSLNSPEFRKAILSKFCETLTKELLDYLCSPRDKAQLKLLALERSLPIGTILSVDKGTRQGEFLGLDENSGLILSGNSKPILSGDVSIKEKSPENKPEHKIDHKNSISSKITPTIAIDFGNTTIHFAFLSSNSKKYQIDIPYDQVLSHGYNGIRDVLKPSLEGFIFDRKQKIDFLFTSVNTTEKTKSSVHKIKEYLISIFPEISFTERKVTEKDIFNCTEISGDFEINRLGADRALKFLFASQQAKKFNKNVITFSFGTAVTCEGVSASLQILENYIFPGIQMAFQAMNHYTALVPLFQANPEMFAPKGKHWNQEIYVQRGVFLSTAASIITTLKMHSPCKGYISGGNAEAILKIVHEMIPNHDLDIEVVPGIETNMLLEYKDQFFTKTSSQIKQLPVTSNHLLKLQNTLQEKANTSPNHSPPQIEEGEIAQVMKTMIKARAPKTIERTLEPKREDFRRIGTHLENIEKEERIDAYMARKFQFHNRETWQERILNGEILVEHGANRKSREKIHLNKIKPTYKLKNYDQIWLFQPQEYEPDAIEKIDVVFDDGDICVFAKPPNMVIHAAGIYGKNTFVNISAKMGYADCAAVHRIDRETSGILACARKSTTRSIISEAFRQGNIEKMYIAVAKGANSLPEKFRVTLPIGEPENSLIRLKLWVNGKFPQHAETWFSKLASFEDYTMYACLPQTGRTNQIRIHLAAIGQWIVGDKMYHPDEQVFIKFYENGYTDWVHEQTLFPRHMLHNAGIMASNISLPSLSSNPIVCELYSDMMDSPIVKNLLKRSSIPTKPNEQREYFKKIFLELHEMNFNQFPEIQQGAAQ